MIKKLLLVTLLILLCGCDNIEKSEELNMNDVSTFDNMEYTDDYNYNDKFNYIMKPSINKVSDSENFQKIMPGNMVFPYVIQSGYSIAISPEDVEKRIGMNYFRYNNGRYYSVHKCNYENIDGYLFITYSDGIVIDGWFVSKMPDKDKFEKLIKGKSTFSDIQKLDDSSILINNGTYKSYHRFNDGTMIEILYKTENKNKVVIDYKWCNDPIRVWDNLLQIDKELINNFS